MVWSPGARLRPCRPAQVGQCGEASAPAVHRFVEASDDATSSQRPARAPVLKVGGSS